MMHDFEPKPATSSHGLRRALDALEQARRLPAGPERTDALKAAGRLRVQAESIAWGTAIKAR